MRRKIVKTVQVFKISPHELGSSPEEELGDLLVSVPLGQKQLRAKLGADILEDGTALRQILLLGLSQHVCYAPEQRKTKHETDST